MYTPQTTENQAIDDAQIPAWALLSTVFITGASVLIVELMGTRILAPFFGSGFYTWSALISVTLAALALGYAIGGHYADRNPDAALLYLLCLGAGLWTIITPSLAGHLLPTFTDLDIRVAVLLSSTSLYFPNLFLLGAIGPFVIRLLLRTQNQAGTTSGLIFAVSTIGSLVGALGTGFFLIPNFGVRSIFTFCGLVLLLVAVLGYLRLKLFRHGTIALGLCLLALINTHAKPGPDSDIELLQQTPSFYGQIQVVRKDGIKMLLVDGIGQNYVVDHGEYTTPYINFIATVPQLLDANDTAVQNALVIGLGAGQLPMLLQQRGITTDIVEIDPLIVSMAETYFGFEAEAERIHNIDGRVFLSRSSNTYDYIVLDAFNADQVAWHLISKQALALARSRLSQHGLLAINFTSITNGDDVASLHHTLQQVFPHVRGFALNYDSGMDSVVLLASRNLIDFSIYADKLSKTQLTSVNQFVSGELDNIHSTVVLSDDFNPVSHQRKQVQILWRKTMREYLGEEELGWLLL